MTKDNEDALRVAESHQKIARMNGGIRSVFISQKSLMESSAHLRRLVRENEAKDALLRQAVEALERLTNEEIAYSDAAPHGHQAIAAIRQHLDQKTT